MIFIGSGNDLLNWLMENMTPSHYLYHADLSLVGNILKFSSVKNYLLTNAFIKSYWLLLFMNYHPINPGHSELNRDYMKWSLATW